MQIQQYWSLVYRQNQEGHFFMFQFMIFLTSHGKCQASLIQHLMLCLGTITMKIRICIFWLVQNEKKIHKRDLLRYLDTATLLLYCLSPSIERPRTLDNGCSGLQEQRKAFEEKQSYLSRTQNSRLKCV